MTDNDNNEEITSTQKKNCKLAQENFENKNVFLNPITEENIHTAIDPHAKILNIEIISSSVDSKGKTLRITPEGLVDSKRNEKDMITYFGYEDNTNGIDYVITPKEDAKDLDERFYGKHFQIRFNPSDSHYYLKDLGHGFGTFIKITSSIVIRNNLLINIGENYIVFTLGIEEDTVKTKIDSSQKEDSDNILNVKIFSGNTKQDIMSYSPKKSPLTIGRSPECDVLVEDSMLSRVHCTLQFKGGNWYIIDGNVIDEEEIRPSTNGTWIYAFEDMEIKDQMTFKANHNLFICSLEENEED